jgi:ribose transport system permease protein
MLDNIMSVMQINPFLKDVVRGVVIVVAVAVYARRRIVNRPERFSSKGSAAAPAAQAMPAERP